MKSWKLWRWRHNRLMSKRLLKRKNRASRMIPPTGAGKTDERRLFRPSETQPD
jgi:hypothetical protein